MGRTKTALAFALFAVLAVPLPVQCATTSAAAAPTPPPNHRVTYRYKTFFDPAGDYWTIRRFDVVFGTVTLTFDPDKSIVGTYAPDFSKPVRVSGRMTGGGNMVLTMGGRQYSARFTPQGLVAISQWSGRNVELWAQFVSAGSR